MVDFVVIGEVDKKRIVSKKNGGTNGGWTNIG